jgi:DNA mismatch repair protein MSH5
VNDYATELLTPGDPVNYEEESQPEEVGLTTRHGKLMRVSTWLDLDNRVSVGCVGAIIAYLQRRRSNTQLLADTDINQVFPFASLEMFNLGGTMLVNTDTLVSLQIVQPESHPNTFNQGPGTSGAKEALSIYGLFHRYARTPQGRTQLRLSFLRPSLDLDYINARLDFISVFVRPANHSVRDKLSKSLGHIRNMRNTVTLLHKGIDGGKAKQAAFKNGV